MPDAKSLLPGRAFRSEHAQLRPEPHSIASHGPDPMDPLQTTRMRNGVLYAAEWPCCHDPLRLSLGSEDPFYYTTHAFGARGCAHPHPHPGGAVGAPAARAECVRLPRARGGVRPTPFRVPLSLLPLVPPRTRSHASARGVASSPKQTSVSFSPRRTVPTVPRRPSANQPCACVLCSHRQPSHARARTPHAGKVSFTPASALASAYLPVQPAHRSAHPEPFLLWFELVLLLLIGGTLFAWGSDVAHPG